jgi:hypothetical protein
MAGTTGLEPAASAVTVSGTSVLSMTWKSTDGILTHYKYVLDIVIVYLGVYHAPFSLLPHLDCPMTQAAPQQLLSCLASSRG